MSHDLGDLLECVAGAGLGSGAVDPGAGVGQSRTRHSSDSSETPLAREGEGGD